MSRGHVTEAAAVDLAGAGTGESAKLLAEAIRPACGGILLVNAAHDWYGLPDRGQHVARCLYRQLTEHRNELSDDIAVILAGQADPLRRLLAGHPSLAARFQAVIDFPGYTPGQLAVTFTRNGVFGGIPAPSKRAEVGFGRAGLWLDHAH